MIAARELPAWAALSGNPAWPYRTVHPMLFSIQPLQFPHVVGRFDAYLAAASGMQLGAIYADGTVRINQGYHWNGASCVPDFPACLRATLLHDFLYQAIGAPRFPMTYAQADAYFAAVAREDGFSLSGPYHAGLSLFGWAYRKLHSDPASEAATMTIYKAFNQRSIS